MSKITIKNRFGAVPNDLLHSSEVSLKAKALYAYIQSKPDDWDFSADRIKKETKDGRDGILSGLTELEKSGYLTRYKKGNEENGKWEWEYVLNVSPESENPYTDNPTSDSPTPDNPTLKKKRNTKKEKEKKNNSSKEEEFTKTNESTQSPVKSVNSNHEYNYGRSDINELCEAVRYEVRSLGLIYDNRKERIFAKHLLDSKAFGDFAESTGLSRTEAAVNIVKAASVLEFWNSKICGPMMIYKHYITVYNEIASKKKEMELKRQKKDETDRLYNKSTIA